MIKKVSEEKKAYVKKLCEEGINKIDDILKECRKENTQNYQDIDISLLINTKDELIKMINILDKSIYKPIYPRFILDYPSSSTLIDYLINIAYEYNKKT